VRYRLRADDERRIVGGLVAAGQVMEAAGARELFTLHAPPLTYRPGPGAHDRWAADLRSAGLRGKVTGVSFHQMGSCRMGVDPATSAIDANNETHEVRNLFVADASAFPTASGVNPMLTVYGIANRAAKKIAARLA
jgi:choline dehydrogenase-like flavoprotein